MYAELKKTEISKLYENENFHGRNPEWRNI
jgi:hypothetical protein